MNIPDITENSALVVAHPDDEALWFSSVLERVGRTVICFLDVTSRPDWSEGRRRAIAELPISGVHSLELIESETFNGADWRNPIFTDYGLDVAQQPQVLPGKSAERYRANFSVLVERLEEELRGYQNVFTHNPWGEYGHEEHVQVYRAVSHVQRALGFRTWFSNYCSNKSHYLMLRYLSGFGSDYVTMNANVELARRLERIYRNNNCWTWPFDDYDWFQQECFASNEGVVRDETPVGHLFPLNYIRIEAPWDRKQRGGWSQTLRRMVRKVAG